MCRLKKRKEITLNNTSVREENYYPSMELEIFAEKTGRSIHCSYCAAFKLIHVCLH